MAVVGLINRWMLRLGGFGGIVLVALFNWWAGLVLLLVLIYGVRRMRIAQVEIARTQFQQSRILRRADYLRDLLLVPGAEKEVRVFGLAPWLRGRFKAEWDDAMGRVWQQRRSSVRDAALAIAPVLLVAAGLVRARRARLPLGKHYYRRACGRAPGSVGSVGVCHDPDKRQPGRSGCSNAGSDDSFGGRPGEPSRRPGFAAGGGTARARG